MKVGDLVRYKDTFRGYEDLVGLIIATNGGGFDVQWANRIYSRFTVELPEFIEKIEHES
tara:strand:- start:1238 stop:1414 length:177 start_codon:yes stop_codon:yes gene_type:complete